jgi:hypothetical protein
MDGLKAKVCVKLYNKRNRRTKPRYVLWGCYLKAGDDYPPTPQGYGKAPTIEQAGEDIREFLAENNATLEELTEKGDWKTFRRLDIQRDYYQHQKETPGFIHSIKGYIPITETPEYINARRRAYRKRRVGKGYKRLDIFLSPKLLRKLQPHLEKVYKRRGIETDRVYGFALVEWLESLDIPD